MLPMLNETIRFAEDNLFNQLFAMKFFRKAYYCDEILYHYRFNECSVSSKFNEQKLQDLNKVYNLLKFYDDGNYDKLIDGFYLEFVQRMFDAIFRSDCDHKVKIKLFKKVLSQSNLRSAIANGDWPCYNTKQRIKKFLIKHKMAKTYFLFVKLKRR